MQKLRNIAIIAHVDHGKTTLVDKMIMQSHVLRDNAKNSGELILDNNDLERERGITILSKNVSVIYKDCKINIIDTPGHADFGGEVERVLNMCDGVLLLVDAFEGTMPQTRFVLQKALSLGKKPIVVINKVDKPNCRPEVVNEQVFDLMFSLGATDEQLDYKTIYGSAKQGWMSHVWNQPTDSISPLLDTILDEIPEPAVVEGTPQMLITSLEYSSYIGRIAVGKVTRGELKTGQNVTLAKRDGVTMQKSRIKELMVFEGLGKKKVDAVPCGEICALIGIDGFEIGDTICDYENPEPLPPIAIDEPTMSMLFTINNSPFFGKDGKYVTSRHIKERLDRELEKEPRPARRTGSQRRQLHRLRAGRAAPLGADRNHAPRRLRTPGRTAQGHRQGDRRQEVRTDRRDDRRLSPGVLGDSDRTGHQTQGNPDQHGNQRRPHAARIHDPLARDHRSAVEHAHRHGRRSDHDTPAERFEPWTGEIEMRVNGSIISGETGTAYAYSIDKLQDRGRFFISSHGTGLRRPGDRRTHPPERHHGQRHQSQAADQHARLGIGRKRRRSPRPRSSRSKKRSNTFRPTNTSK